MKKRKKKKEKEKEKEKEKITKMPYSLKRYFTCAHCETPSPVEDLENCEFCEAQLCASCCRFNYLLLAICPYCEENEE